MSERDRIRTAQQVIVLDPSWTVWVHNTIARGRIDESTGKPAADLFAGVDRISEVLSKNTECVDEPDRELYATRLDLIPHVPGLIFLLVRTSFQA